jgi:hypothetical protein
MSEEEKKITFDDFKAFHDVHPDLDNGEYYAEFPTANKSTIRSWKNKLRVPPPQPNTPPQPNDDVRELEEYLIQTLIQQTNTNARELEGLDNKSKIVILRNRQKALSEDKVKRTPNSSILPAPKPIGQSNKKFGIDEYIVFDKDKNEIRMEIPMDVLHDPEKNKRLGLIR